MQTSTTVQPRQAGQEQDQEQRKVNKYKETENL